MFVGFPSSLFYAPWRPSHSVAILDVKNKMEEESCFGPVAAEQDWQ
jgi:hypothetical protein